MTSVVGESPLTCHVIPTLAGIRKVLSKLRSSRSTLLPFAQRWLNVQSKPCEALTRLNRFMWTHNFCSSVSKWLVEILVLTLGRTTSGDNFSCLWFCVLFLVWVCFLFAVFALLLCCFSGFIWMVTWDGSFCLQLQLNRIPSTGRCDSHLCASRKKNIYGVNNLSHWRTHIFQDGYCTTNQLYCPVASGNNGGKPLGSWPSLGVFPLPGTCSWAASNPSTAPTTGRSSNRRPLRPLRLWKMCVAV